MAVQILTEARVRIEPMYREVVAGLPAHLRHVIGYHIGWWDDEGWQTIGTGKSIRPALVLCCAKAVTATVDSAADDVVAAAVAVELVHDFTLLHDDVMDGDLLRRNRPTVWTRFGTSSAILAGDMLLAVAVGLLAERNRAATAVLARALRALCEGQCADIAYEDAREVDLAACVRMAANKTGALIAAACELGAVVSGAAADHAQQLREFGGQLGLGYQIADDLLGIWGDPAKTGKQVYSDLARRKKSLPVAAALASGSTAGRELGRRYSSESVSEPGEFPVLATLIEEAGGLRWAEEQLARCCAGARAVLDTVNPGHGKTGDLLAVVDLVERWR